MTAWSDSFDDILRRNLPHLGRGAPLESTARLLDLGLDSLRAIDLLVQLEEEFGVSVPDELLAQEMFESAGSLWETISGLVAPLPGTT